MKNSLFKRACAAVVAVPVALAQCLSVASAVAADETLAAAPAQDAVTLETLLGIPAENGYEINEDGNYEKYSEWNINLAGIISQVKSGSIDTAKLMEKAVAKAGAYADVVKAVSTKLSDVKYTVDEDGKITLTAELDNVAEAFDTLAQEYVDAAFSDIVVEYDVQQKAIDKIKNTKFFDEINISGKVKVVLGTDALISGTTVNAEYSFTDGDGKTYTGTGAIAYAEAKLAEVKDAANKAIQKLADEYDLTDEELDKKIRESKEFKDIVDKYSAPITLTEEEVVAAARASEDYKKLVADLVAEGLSEEDAKAEIENSDDFKDLITKYSQEEISLTPEEVEAAILKSDDYAQKAAEIKAEYNEKVADMRAKLVSSVTSFNDKIDVAADIFNKAKSYLEKAKTYSASKTFADTAALLKTVDNNRDKLPAFVERRLPATPSSFAQVAASNMASSIFSEIVSQIANNAGVEVGVSAVQLGAYADTFKDIELSVDSLTYTASAKAADPDAAAVESYFKSTYDADTVTSWLEVESKGSVADLDNGKASVDFQLKRVVAIETKPVVTTVTSATTTEATTTEATTTEATTTEATTTEATTTKATTTEGTTTQGSTTTEGTTTTATELVFNPEYKCEAVAGYYLNVDNSYSTTQVSELVLNIQRQIITTYQNGDKLVTNDGDAETIDLKGKFDFGTQKPSQAIEGQDVLTAREIKLYAAEDIKDSKGNVVIAKGTEIPATVEAYVGVKGDINLDGVADAKDASNVLAIYADLSTGGGMTADDIQCSTSPVVTGAADKLDVLALFLADVDNENDPNNHVLAKSKRTINASDASYILGMYSAVSTSGGGDLDYRAMWNEVLGDFAPKA